MAAVLPSSRRWMAVVLAVALGWSGLPLRPALATPASSEATERQAIDLAQKAKVRYQQGQHEEAARLFMQAYALVPEPTLLFNAARAYEEGGHPQAAIPLFELYLQLNRYDDDDSLAGRKEAERRLHALRARQARPTPPPLPPQQQPGAAEARTEPTGSPQSPATPTPAPLPPAGSTPPLAQPQPEVAPPPVIAPAVRKPGLFQRLTPDGWSTRKLAAVSTLAGGGALLLAGGLLAWANASRADDLEARLAADRRVQGGRVVHPTVTQREVDEAAGSRGAGWLVGLGVTAVATGAVLLWLDRDSAGTTGAWLQPHDDGAVAGLTGRF